MLLLHVLSVKKGIMQHLKTQHQTQRELKSKNSAHVVERELFTKKPNSRGVNMSKKSKLVTEEVENSTANLSSEAAVKSEPVKKDQNKQDKKAGKDNKKDKKKKEKKHTISKKTKETVSELKKVTWPTFTDVVKRTGVVLAVVVIFAVVLFAIDLLLGFVSSALMGKPFVPFG